MVNANGLQNIHFKINGRKEKHSCGSDMFGSLTELSTLSYFEWRSTHEDGMELARGCMPMPWPDTRHTCNIFHFHGTGFYTRIQLRGDPNDETENWHTIPYMHASERRLGQAQWQWLSFRKATSQSAEVVSRAHDERIPQFVWNTHIRKRTRKSNKKKNRKS